MRTRLFTNKLVTQDIPEIEDEDGLLASGICALLKTEVELEDFGKVPFLVNEGSRKIILKVPATNLYAGKHNALLTLHFTHNFSITKYFNVIIKEQSGPYFAGFRPKSSDTKT